MVGLARLVASGLGVGYAPVAPGTVGSLVAVLVGLVLLPLGTGVIALAALGATLGGLWAVWHLGAEDDPGWIVIDEVAGQWIAMAALSAVTVQGVVAAFIGFRLLDILKPGPIGWADRMPGARGVMLDDVLAGLVVAGVIGCVRTVWPGWL